MRSVSLLLAVAAAALVETSGANLKSQVFNDKSDHIKKSHKFIISGMGVTEEPMGVFSVDENTGMVYVHKPIDREKHNYFHIKFDIYDKTFGEKIDSELAFDVQVKDINDNKPTFLQTEIQANVKENTPEGYLSVQLKTTDMDEINTPRSKITLSIISQQPQVPKIELVPIDDSLAQLKFEGCFDYDKIKTYEIIVEAKDHGTPPLSSTAVVTLNIVDTNTHQPTFKESKYNGKVMESLIQNDVLRIAVDDKDTPKTPGWRAKYFFIKGNEEGNYKIETDPETNEGILSVIKEKDFEHTTITDLEIGVENEEPLFVCKDESSGTATHPPPNSVNVTIKVIDVNDPPVFAKESNLLYVKEEEMPGKVLFTPEVHDVDSDNIRYVLLGDPADWVTIDEETGEIKSSKKMDRESSFVKDNIYKVVIGAVDDGEPPATGTSTILLHLGDINDNKPALVNKSLIICGDKTNKVMVPAKDLDAHPYSGPFSFSLGGDDKTLEQGWKVEPSFGMEAGLVSLKTLYNGNYSVPLVIQDQQGMSTHDTLELIVCDCEEADICRSKVLPSSKLGPAAIGMIFAGLLSFLLLLLLCMCVCGSKGLKHTSMVEEEGNQTLIKYNQEGGGAACTASPALLLRPTNGAAVTDGLKQDVMQFYQRDPAVAQDMEAFNTSWLTLMNSKMTSMETQYQGDTLRGLGGQAMYSAWDTNRNNHQGNLLTYQRSFRLQSQHHIADHIERRLDMIEGNQEHYSAYEPYKYAYEGGGSTCQSLDELSLCNLGDDLQFLNDLGPKFKTLGEICHQTIQEKNTKI